MRNVISAFQRYGNFEAIEDKYLSDHSRPKLLRIPLWIFSLLFEDS